MLRWYGISSFEKSSNRIQILSPFIWIHLHFTSAYFVNDEARHHLDGGSLTQEIFLWNGCQGTKWVLFFVGSKDRAMIREVTILLFHECILALSTMLDENMCSNGGAKVTRSFCSEESERLSRVLPRGHHFKKDFLLHAFILSFSYISADSSSSDLTLSLGTTS